MTILPAIDLLNGAAVRLKQGAEKTAKVYSTNPAEPARRWQNAGARIIHVVNLDGAFGRSDVNRRAVEAILSAVSIPIELGGGIRSLQDAAGWLNDGVSRVIFGTAAVTEPQIIAEAAARFGAERVVVGIDARQDKAAVQGWEQQTEIGVVSLAQAMKALGVERIIYTDVSRDGELIGPNISGTDGLARACGLRVIASGGFAAMTHFEQLAALGNPLIEGAVVGTALYEGALDLATLIKHFEK